MFPSRAKLHFPHFKLGTYVPLSERYYSVHIGAVWQISPSTYSISIFLFKYRPYFKVSILNLQQKLQIDKTILICKHLTSFYLRPIWYIAYNRYTKHLMWFQYNSKLPPDYISSKKHHCAVVLLTTYYILLYPALACHQPCILCRVCQKQKFKGCSTNFTNGCVFPLSKQATRILCFNVKCLKCLASFW